MVCEWLDNVALHVIFNLLVACSVSAGGVVDCGTGDKTCAGATGKICLVQRGGNMFCEKVYNCVQGGGVGTIIYGKADEPACETFEGVLDYTGCPNPSSGWPVAMTVTRGQGEALLALVKANAGVQITLDARQAANPLPLDFMSGTSMATPTGELCSVQLQQQLVRACAGYSS